jgi:hypothetical protein
MGNHLPRNISKLTKADPSARGSTRHGLGAALRRPYNGSWVGDIKMFRNLERRELMQFVYYQELTDTPDGFLALLAESSPSISRGVGQVRL